MHASLHLALTVSRFRFWCYTGGTYVVGVALGMPDWGVFFTPAYYLYLFHFFVPANIFIYGINDLWDGATDGINPKKQGKEHLLIDGERRDLVLLLGMVAVFSAGLLLVQDWTGRAVFLAFLFLAYFYSAPPLRFKETPLLDFSSNMLYIMPGIFGFTLAAGALPPPLLIAAGFCHIAAMHIFSAIPDIECDRKAGIMTTAVWVGFRPALILCLIFWTVFATIVLALAGGHPLALPVLIYPALPALLLLRESVTINRIYWYLPFVNTALGGLAFDVLVYLKM
ncbi:MAG TPA: prenyltransferase [Methanoculleus sp.]|nr:prenyltransferase [Methanoculleus sp.]